MYRFFKNNNPFVVIALFILLLLMKQQALLHPVMPIALPNHLIFESILKLLPLSAMGYTMIAVIMVFLQAIYLNYIAERHKLFGKPGSFVALMYITLTSLYPAFNYFSEPLLINWFVILAIDIMLSFPKTLQPNKKLFNAGFAISIPAILQAPALGFICLLIFGYLLLRSYRSKELVVAVLGYLTPFYFLAVILYLIDHLSFFTHLPELGFDMHLLSASRIYLAGTLMGVLMLLIAGSYAFQLSSPRMTIYVRRSWFLIYIYLIIAIAVTLLAVSALRAEWLLVLPALSLIVAQVFYMENNRRLSNFIFYFSLALLIFSQITYK